MDRAPGTPSKTLAVEIRGNSSCSSHLFPSIATVSQTTHNCDTELILAIISTSTPPVTSHSSSTTRPHSQATIDSPSHSPARPASRRSNITRQIYQFALGYPQTPPDDSPNNDSLDPLDHVVARDSVSNQQKMGSFLFQWYAGFLFFSSL